MLIQKTENQIPKVTPNDEDQGWGDSSVAKTFTIKKKSEAQVLIPKNPHKSLAGVTTCNSSIPETET